MSDITLRETNCRGKALLQMTDNRLVAYRKGQLVVYKNEKKLKTVALPAPLWKRAACQSRLCERILHNDVRWAIELSDDDILFLYQSSVYKANLTTGAVEEDFTGFRGRPFSVTQLDNRVLIGDYGTNERREEVRIYERTGESWHTVYTFPAGIVCHIHSIIPNKGSFYILTGDEDNESGIWKANNAFSTVLPVLIGSQQYRCCQLLPADEDCGWYVTDAPSETNGLYYYSGNCISELCKIPGTAIYGTLFDGGLIFSTTVEPEAHARNRFDYWLSRKPGAGIQGNKTTVFVLKDGKLNEVAHYEHDGKPLRLFQYATVHFSNEKNGVVYFTPVNVKAADNRIWKLIAE